jgi:hypothetical protein
MPGVFAHRRRSTETLPREMTCWSCGTSRRVEVRDCARIVSTAARAVSVAPKSRSMTATLFLIRAPSLASTWRASPHAAIALQNAADAFRARWKVVPRPHGDLAHRRGHYYLPRSR